MWWSLSLSKASINPLESILFVFSTPSLQTYQKTPFSVAPCLRTAVISCHRLRPGPGQRPLQRLGHSMAFTLPSCQLRLCNGGQRIIVNIVNTLSWAMLELLESPGDRFCDKLKNEENCDDDSQAGSPLAIIEDTAPSNNTHFFEGVEKNLEVWFTNSNGDTEHSDLRLIPRYH